MNLIDKYITSLNEGSDNSGCLRSKKLVAYWTRALQIANKKLSECKQDEKCVSKWNKNISKLKSTLAKFQNDVKSKC